MILSCQGIMNLFFYVYHKLLESLMGNAKSQYGVATKFHLSLLTGYSHFWELMLEHEVSVSNDLCITEDFKHRPLAFLPH